MKIMSKENNWYQRTIASVVEGLELVTHKEMVKAVSREIEATNGCWTSELHRSTRKSGT